MLYENNKVLVVMPAFNSEDTISNSIDSVVNQSYFNFDLIVCDDNSSDSTVDIVKRYAFRDSRIKLIKNRYSKGAAGARNSCISHSKARFVAFLDSDDLWLPNKLDVQVNYMLDNNIEISHGEYVMFDQTQDLKVVSPSLKVSFSDIINKCDMGCLTVMIDRSKIGNFSFPVSPKEDYALWVVLMKRGYSSYLYPGCYARYYKQQGSISSSKIKEVTRQWHVLKVFGEVGFFNRLKCISIYMINGFIKHFFNKV